MNHNKTGLRRFYREKLKQTDFADKNNDLLENLCRLNLSWFLKKQEASSKDFGQKKSFKQVSLIEPASQRAKIPEGFKKNSSSTTKKQAASLKGPSLPVIAAYQALWPKEPLLESFYKKEKNWHFVFPVMEKDNRMGFYKPARGQSFRRHALGFLEPDPKFSDPVESHLIEVFLIPALAFDRKGQRLGRGFGCYDRFLKNKKALKVGLCWNTQIHHSDLPKEPHDISMDVIVTEACVLVPNAYRFYFNHFQKVGYG